MENTSKSTKDCPPSSQSTVGLAIRLVPKLIGFAVNSSWRSHCWSSLVVWTTTSIVHGGIHKGCIFVWCAPLNIHYVKVPLKTQSCLTAGLLIWILQQRSKPSTPKLLMSNSSDSSNVFNTLVSSCQFHELTSHWSHCDDCQFTWGLTIMFEIPSIFDLVWDLSGWTPEWVVDAEM
ncbi:hypothetical protein P691DRAFT_781061 [Macrolepiota fuliginosa MF-IS2]|uniref:Uncharacterized protein n=1 Tax=Macrolepiota fuliginosa MF-IS2 TaxID=1400762 RepID=A0A9P5XCD9_9AGAR|nr:hypothetical protein P691DRAFT_781061 [Macrolepiota fuliginosa MF-IS2]